MKPHPQFADRSIPSRYSLGNINLKALSVSDLDRDFNAIMHSADEIRAAHPDLSWPAGLTRQANMIDLAWHQKEFEARRSFAWVIEDNAAAYLGCLYVYPSIAGDRSADVAWWWKTGAQADRLLFRAKLSAWLSSEDWPRLEYRLRTPAQSPDN